MSVATRSADDTTHTQAELRYTTLRVGELIRTARLVCAAPDNDLVFWSADRNQNDVIDVNEIVYIEHDDPNNSLKLLEFDPNESTTVLAALGLPDTQPVLATLAQTGTKAALVQAYAPANEVRRTTLLRDCNDVVFTADQNPPRTRRLTISFDLAEGNGVHRYEIGAALLASAQYLLSGDASALVGDDD